MSDDLIERLRKQDMRQRPGGYFVFNGIMAEAAIALTEARAEIERLREQVFELEHGVEDQMEEAAYHAKQRAAVESELATLRARVREVVGLGLDVISEERGWGTYSRMEGSEIYTDADVFSRAARQLNEDLK